MTEQREAVQAAATPALIKIDVRESELLEMPRNGPTEFIEYEPTDLWFRNEQLDPFCNNEDFAKLRRSLAGDQKKLTRITHFDNRFVSEINGVVYDIGAVQLLEFRDADLMKLRLHWCLIRNVEKKREKDLHVRLAQSEAEVERLKKKLKKMEAQMGGTARPENMDAIGTTEAEDDS